MDNPSVFKTHPRFSLLFLAAMMVVLAYNIAQSQPAPKSYDPCNTEFHFSAPISSATSATIYLASGDKAGSTGGPIDICSISATIPTSSTLSLVACDTGTTCTHQNNVTGAYAGANVINVGGAGYTVGVVPSGQDLDFITTGTGAQGVVTYVRGLGKIIPTVTNTPTPTPSPT